jgi:hypothetical protein
MRHLVDEIMAASQFTVLVTSYGPAKFASKNVEMQVDQVKKWFV